LRQAYDYWQDQPGSCSSDRKEKEAVKPFFQFPFPKKSLEKMLPNSFLTAVGVRFLLVFFLVQEEKLFL